MHLKNIPGIAALVMLHLIWLLLPILAGFELMWLSPVCIVLCCFIVGYYHNGFDVRFVVYALAVYLAAFALSAIGVSTGRIFGSFFFGRNLGVLVLDTPLVIGLFWLLLSYCSSSVVSSFTPKRPPLNLPIVKALLASVLMLAIDLLIEPIASTIDFWYWKYQETPLQNYTAWFVFAFVFNFLFQQLEIHPDNKTTLWFLSLFVLLLIAINLLSMSSLAS